MSKSLYRKYLTPAWRAFSFPSGDATQNNPDEAGFGFSNNIFTCNVELLIRALDTSVCGIVLTNNCQPDNPIIYCNAAFGKINF